MYADLGFNWKIGGGTGYNIEAMGKFVDVPSFFGQVFLVDFSPSLCQVARDRFERLGWKNVKVICQDARHFRLEDHDDVLPAQLASPRPSLDGKNKKRAELITMSYSLSMIPEYYPVIDSLASLLAPNGIIGVADFYVQSRVEYESKKGWIGGEINRHCMWISRVFWRTWFEADRVNLDAARRVCHISLPFPHRPLTSSPRIISNTASAPSSLSTSGLTSSASAFLTTRGLVQPRTLLLYN